MATDVDAAIEAMEAYLAQGETILRTLKEQHSARARAARESERAGELERAPGAAPRVWRACSTCGPSTRRSCS